jgi:hypothetical protein
MHDSVAARSGSVDGRGPGLAGAAQPYRAGLGPATRNAGGPRRQVAMPDGDVHGPRKPGLALAARVVAGAPSPGGHGRVALPRIGLVFPARLPFEAWLGVGAQLAAASSSAAWCLGDWLVYGQAAFAGRYRDAVERTGLDYQTLRNYAWVAGRFELSRRRDSLSFGHHAEVAALPAPEQDFWLRKAEEFGWPVMRLRREVRSSLAERGQGPPGLESGPDGDQAEERPAVIRVTVTPAQLALCERAADQERMALRAWAAQALERAAGQSLTTRHDSPVRRLPSSALPLAAR